MSLSGTIRSALWNVVPFANKLIACRAGMKRPVFTCAILSCTALSCGSGADGSSPGSAAGSGGDSPDAATESGAAGTGQGGSAGSAVGGSGGATGVPVPTGVQASDGTHTDRVAITWSSVNGAEQYRVYRRGEGEAAFSLLGQSSTSAYDDFTATPLEVNDYAVTAVVPDDGEGPQSASDSGYRQVSHTNVVIVFVDDLGLGDLGAYGQKKITTPNIDQMASEGMRFTDYYSAPWCGPARSSLLEGKHLGKTYLRKCLNMPISVEIMPMRFQDAGYATGMFGKWGFATIEGGYRVGEPFTVSDGAPEHEGFDEFVGFLTHRDAHVHFLDNPAQASSDSPQHPYYDDIRRQLFRIEGGTTKAYPIATDRYVQDEMADQVVDFIARHKSEPFFLYAPFTVPHAELVVPPDGPGENLSGQYLTATGESIFPETPWSGSNDTYRRHQDKPKAVYAAMISRLDRDVGRILQTLRGLHLEQRTLVVLTSDNGSHMAGGRTAEDVAFFDSTAGFRGYKFDLWEGGVRAPLIAWWPQTVPANTVRTEPVAVWDLYPTFADATSVPAATGLDGVSIVPLLQGGAQSVHDYIYLEGWTDEAYTGTALAVRQGSHKLVRVRIGTDHETLGLFDLATDPREEHNLLHDEAQLALVNSLIGIMNTDRTDRDNLFTIAAEPLLPGTATYGTAAGDTMTGTMGPDHFVGLEGDDIISGAMGADRLFGNGGNDIIHGGKNSDLLRGGQGNDTLYGDLGDDVLYGDRGDDLLEDSSGADDYHYLADNGFDVIRDFVGRNELIFEGIAAGQLTASRSGNDLVISVASPPGGVTIIDYYATSAAWTITPTIPVPN